MSPRLRIESSLSFRRMMAFGIASFSLLVLVALGSWSWLFRDGLAPGFVPSSGFEALRRFFADFWPVAVFCLVLFVIAFFVAPRKNPTGKA